MSKVVTDAPLTNLTFEHDDGKFQLPLSGQFSGSHYLKVSRKPFLLFSVLQPKAEFYRTRISSRHTDLLATNIRTHTWTLQTVAKLYEHLLDDII